MGSATFPYFPRHIYQHVLRVHATYDICVVVDPTPTSSLRLPPVVFSLSRSFALRPRLGHAVVWFLVVAFVACTYVAVVVPLTNKNKVRCNALAGGQSTGAVDAAGAVGMLPSSVRYRSCASAEEDDFLGLFHFWVSGVPTVPYVRPICFYGRCACCACACACACACVCACALFALVVGTVLLLTRTRVDTVVLCRVRSRLCRSHIAGHLNNQRGTSAIKRGCRCRYRFGPRPALRDRSFLHFQLVLVLLLLQAKQTKNNKNTPLVCFLYSYMSHQ